MARGEVTHHVPVSMNALCVARYRDLRPTLSFAKKKPAMPCSSEISSRLIIDVLTYANVFVELVVWLSMLSSRAVPVFLSRNSRARRQLLFDARGRSRRRVMYRAEPAERSRIHIAAVSNLLLH